MDLNLGQGASTGGLSYKGLQLYHNYKTDATDKSPQKSNHGVMYTGRSLAFDGVNDYVDLDGLTIDGNQMTFALWVKSSQASPYSYILDFNDTNNTSNSNRFLFAWNGNTANVLSYYDNGSWSNLGATPNDNSWHRVIFTVNNTEIKSYVDNGTPTTVTAVRSLALDSSTIAKLAADRLGTGGMFNGSMSNVQIWDKAWTADDVAYDYANVQATPNDIANNSTALSVANCRTWLPMTEGADNTLYDGGVVLGDELVENGGFALGDELVENGGFDTDLVGWAGGAGGVISHTGSEIKVINAGYNDDARQTLTFESGKSYLVTATMVSTTNTQDPQVKIYDTLSDSSLVDSITFDKDATNLTQSFVVSGITPGAANHLRLHSYGPADKETVWDNISVKEVTNWTLGTGWSISEVAGDNKAVLDASEGGLAVNNLLTPNRDYRVEFDYTKTAGGLQFRPDGMGADTHVVLPHTAPNSGRASAVVNSSTYTTFNLRQSGAFIGSIDNISVKEVQPKENGTITNGATWTTGVIGSEVETPFDGVNDYVDIPDDSNSYSQVSLSCWINPEAQSTFAELIGYGIIREQSRGITFRLNGVDTAFWGTTIQTPDNELSLVTCVYTGSKMQIFINGSLAKEKSATGTATFINQYMYNIGDPDGTKNPKGNIHNVSIFDHALTATEVSELYALGKDGDATTHSQAIDEYVGDELCDFAADVGENNYSNITREADGSITFESEGSYSDIRTTGLSAGKTYEVSITIESWTNPSNSATSGKLNLNNGVSYPALATFGQTGTSTIVYTTPNNATYGNAIRVYSTTYTDEINISNLSVKEVKGDHLVGYWKNTGKQKWDDLSGQGNHGTFKGHTFGNIPQTGLMSYNKPMVFDGVDDYVDMIAPASNNFDTDNKFAISAWVSVDDFATINNSHIFEVGSVNTQYSLFFESAQLRLRTVNTTGYYNHLPYSLTGTGQKHIVGVYNGTQRQLWVDGVMVASDSYTDTLATNNSQMVRIGAYGGVAPNFFFDGLINEVAVFTDFDTFGADEVSELYNNGLALDATTHSKVDNLQGYWRNTGDSTWVDRTPVLGGELVTNGGFDSGLDGWSTNTGTHSVVNGKLVTTSSSTSNELSETACVGFQGKTYIVTQEATNFTPATAVNGYIRLDGVYDPSNIISFTETNPSVTFVAYRDFTFIKYFGGSSNHSITLDNISVKEVKGGNDGTVSGTPETILLPEARDNRDTMGFPINNVNNGYLALHGDGYVEVADDASLPSGNESRTLEVWVDFKSTGSTQSLIDLGTNAVINNRFGLLIVGNDRIYVAGQQNDFNTGVSATEGWNHLTVTYDNTDNSMIVYKDGVSIGTKTFTTSFLTAGFGVKLGRNKGGGETATSPIDEPRIYNRALTEAEVLQNYNAGKNTHRND